MFTRNVRLIKLTHIAIVEGVILEKVVIGCILLYVYARLVHTHLQFYNIPFDSLDSLKTLLLYSVSTQVIDLEVSFN